MSDSSRTEAADLLRAWQECVGPREAARILESLLVDHVEPCLRDISARTQNRLSRLDGDAEDLAAEVRGEVVLGLMLQLRSIRERNLPPIRDLRAYLTSAVYNANFTLLRARSPQRARLHNRLRYVLRNDGRFALWESEHGALAGLAQWAGQSWTAPAPAMHFAPAGIQEFLEKVFAASEAPLAFAVLANLAAELMGVRDLPALELEGVADLASPQPEPESDLDGRRRLAALWKEVRMLPAGQRAALLLNLRDGNGQGVVELLPATGVASFGELAEALELSVQELARIWNDLPLDDAAIAEQRGVTRQQVINLRKSARARLGRRLGSEGGNISADSPSTPAGRSLRAAGKAVRRLFGAGGERP